MTIEIETGIPLPVGYSGEKYPFHQMEVGQSFAIPLSGERVKIGNKGQSADLTSYRVTHAASQHKRRHGQKFITRTLKAEGVVRCWRVA